MKLVFILKEDVASNSLAAHVIKSVILEGVFVMDVKECFLGETNKKVEPTSLLTSTLSPILSLSRYT